jgi:large subunit ribosomal protein L29
MSKKTAKLHELSTGELQTRLSDAREELMNLRFQQSTGELTDHTRLRFTRRQIARLLTLIGERERMEMLEGES